MCQSIRLRCARWDCVKFSTQPLVFASSVLLDQIANWIRPSRILSRHFTLIHLQNKWFDWLLLLPIVCSTSFRWFYSVVTNSLVFWPRIHATIFYRADSLAVFWRFRSCHILFVVSGMFLQRTAFCWLLRSTHSMQMQVTHAMWLWYNNELR